MKEKKNKEDKFTGFHALGSWTTEDLKLEAQMTLGHFYLVHHSKFTYNIITEINEHYIIEYYCHIYFLSKITAINEHKPTDHKICISPRHLRYRVP